MMKFHAVAGLLALSMATLPALADESKLNIEKIEKISGMKGEFNEKEGVYKVSYPRKDLEVMTAGVKMTPPMGLTAWAAFTKSADHTMVMGDIVMTEGQVNDVMSVALGAGLDVTALHNHFFGDSPKIMFMHIGGMGDEEKLASAVRDVFTALKESTKSSFPKVLIDPAKTTLDPKKIDEVLDRSGQLKDGVYKVTIGRKTQMDGIEVGNAMGVNTWAAFAGSDKEAVVDGDFAMLESELQGVLKALRKAKINIVAIHNHMTMENPRIIFLHFWGIGQTARLAGGIKAALDTQNPKGVLMTTGAFAETVNFDEVKPGSLPPGWISGVTGKGSPKWAVEPEPAVPGKSNVLKQSGEGAYPWCVKKDVSLTDGFVEVKFKPISGNEDQAGGLVWRWKDGDNYYVARANALENNVSLYYMERGSRKKIKYVDAPVAANLWHTLRVNFSGTHIAVSLDGKTYIEEDDGHLSGSGAVGVWTKADSVTSFDDFSFGIK